MLSSNLNEELTSLKAENAWLNTSLDVARSEIEQLKHNISLLQKYIFGRKSEKTLYIDPNQQALLFNEAEANTTLPIDQLDGTANASLAIEETLDIDAGSSPTPETRGRKPLSKKLPREQIALQLPQSSLSCECGGELTHIGEEISEELHYRSASYIRREYVRYKYACSCCEEKVVRAPAAFRPLSKCIASSGMLADVLVKKYCDHLPLYRQSQILQRHELELSRSTLSNWVIKSADKFAPMISVMKDELLSRGYICSDETPLNVLENAESKNYMWVHLSGDRDQRIVIYDYNESRGGSVPNNFLYGFKGYHQSDGYIGYNDLHGQTCVIGVGCWAHARRKFFDITSVVTTRGFAHEALDLINNLYKIEKGVSGLSYEDIKKKRMELSVPILEALYKRLKYMEDKAPPNGYLSKAIGYCLNQWEKLTAYLKDGRIRIDNNDTERVIKPFVIGRNNWMFSNKECGAKASAIIYSLVETCKSNKVNVFDYFKYILENIHKAENNDQLREMLPWKLDKELLKRNRPA